IDGKHCRQPHRLGAAVVPVLLAVPKKDFHQDLAERKVTPCICTSDEQDFFCLFSLSHLRSMPRIGLAFEGPTAQAFRTTLDSLPNSAPARMWFGNRAFAEGSPLLYSPRSICLSQPTRTTSSIRNASTAAPANSCGSSLSTGSRTRSSIH